MPEQVRICRNSKDREYDSARGLRDGITEEGRNSLDRKEEGGYFREWGRDTQAESHVWGTERFRVTETWHVIVHGKKQTWGKFG